MTLALFGRVLIWTFYTFNNVNFHQIWQNYFLAYTDGNIMLNRWTNKFDILNKYIIQFGEIHFAILNEDMRCGALSSFLIAVAQMAISCKTGSPQLFIIHPPLPYAPNKVGRYCTMEVKALHIVASEFES